MQAVHTELIASDSADTHRQVQLAQNTQLMGQYLTPLFFPGQPEHAADCRILDMKYEVGEYCTLLYQLGPRMVIGTFRWGAVEGELPASARLIEPLGMQVYSFEHDPALPGLATALDPRRMHKNGQKMRLAQDARAQAAIKKEANFSAHIKKPAPTRA